jgi:hypothetical protein
MLMEGGFKIFISYENFVCGQHEAEGHFETVRAECIVKINKFPHTKLNECNKPKQVFSKITTDTSEIFLASPKLVYRIAKKVKVKLSLCLTKHHAMKAYWGNGSITPLIL